MDGLLLKIWDWAVNNGLALPFILWFLWNKYQDREKKKSGEVVSYEDMVKMRERLSILEANQETCRSQRKTLFENISELNKDIDSRIENLMKSIFESKK